MKPRLMGEGIYPYRQPRFLSEAVERLQVELSPITAAMKELCGEGWEPETVEVVEPYFPRSYDVATHNNKPTMAEHEANAKRRWEEFKQDYPRMYKHFFMKPEGTKNE